MTIKKKLRNRIADLSSGPVYYDEVSDWHVLVKYVLRDFGLSFRRDQTPDIHGNEGRGLLAIEDEFGVTVSHLCFTWYRMQSGRWEIINYLT